MTTITHAEIDAIQDRITKMWDGATVRQAADRYDEIVEEIDMELDLLDDEDEMDDVAEGRRLQARLMALRSEALREHNDNVPYFCNG